MNILVTGATGFIGRNLLAALSERNELNPKVYLLGSRPVEGFNWIDDRRVSGRCTFLSEHFKDAGVPEIEVVLHLAASTPKSSEEANGINSAVTNIVNFEHLLLNLPNQPKLIVLASSLDVYGPTNKKIAECAQCAPPSLYGQSKLLTEKMLDAWSAGKMNAAVDTQVLRIGHVYGPGEQAYRKIIPASILRLISGQRPVVTTSGEELRSFIHISDCCNMILNSITLPTREGPINVGSASPISVLDLVELLCDIHFEETGSQVKPEVLTQSSVGSNFVLDVSRMTRLLGSEQVKLRDGLRDEYKTFAMKA